MFREGKKKTKRIGFMTCHHVTYAIFYHKMKTDGKTKTNNN